MKLSQVQYENGTYRAYYVKDNVPHNVMFKLDFGYEGINNAIHFDILRDIYDAVFIGADEYLIIYPKLYECLPDDTSFIIAIAREYVQTHFNGNSAVACEILYTDDDDFSAEEFKNSLFAYYDWEY